MNGRVRKGWPETAMKLAYDIANCRSEDPWLQVGAACIKHDNTIVLGYNGAPVDIDIDWSDRDERRPYVLHAEENVLSNVARGEVKILAVTHIPCERCMKLIAQKGISTVFYSELTENYDHDLAFKMAAKFKITLRQIGSQ